MIYSFAFIKISQAKATRNSIILFNFSGKILCKRLSKGYWTSFAIKEQYMPDGWTERITRKLFRKCFITKYTLHGTRRAQISSISILITISSTLKNLMTSHSNVSRFTCNIF